MTAATTIISALLKELGIARVFSPAEIMGSLLTRTQHPPYRAGLA
jgi:hypothetical protein